MTDRIHSATRWKAITPSNTARLEPVPTAIMVNVAGLVNIVGDDGVAADFQINAGAPLPCQPHQVLATGTTATGIRGLYHND